MQVSTFFELPQMSDHGLEILLRLVEVQMRGMRVQYN